MPVPLRHILVSVGLLTSAACGKKGVHAGETSHTCDDVEAAMRRIDVERTKDMKPGRLAEICVKKSAEYTQARIECVVASKTYDDLKACKDPSKAPLQPAAGATAALEWIDVPTLGVKLNVPGNVTIDQGRSAFLSNGTFKMNLFKVDESSLKSAAEVKASLQKEPGFVKFTKDEPGDKAWHFDYELDGGRAGTSARIDVGQLLDCGVHGLALDVVAAVSTACASAKAI